MYFKSVDETPDSSMRDKTSIMNANTYENISSSIEMETKQQLEIN